jgi:ABC-type amino acid transport substrate-binding protein
MSITEERKKEVDFSLPYFITGQMILVRADSNITKYQVEQQKENIQSYIKRGV